MMKIIKSILLLAFIISVLGNIYFLYFDEDWHTPANEPDINNALIEVIQ